jgi:hypothetical protein
MPGFTLFGKTVGISDDKCKRHCRIFLIFRKMKSHLPEKSEFWVHRHQPFFCTTRKTFDPSLGEKVELIPYCNNYILVKVFRAGHWRSFQDYFSQFRIS